MRFVRFVLRCILNGLKTMVDAVFVLFVLLFPPYLTLEVSLWFAPLVVLELLFFVGATSGRGR